MTYNAWYAEWKTLWEEQIAAEHAVADYAAAHQLLSMQEWLEFYRLQQTVNDIHSRREELTERYNASQQRST